MWGFFSVDQSGDQLSEDPGFALLYVCAAVLPRVNVKWSPHSFEHTYITSVFNVCPFSHIHLFSVWAGWSLWRCSTVSFCWGRRACSSKRPTWKKSSPTLHPLLSPAVQTPELTALNMFTSHHSKVAVSLSTSVFLCACQTFCSCTLLLQFTVITATNLLLKLRSNFWKNGSLF